MTTDFSGIIKELETTAIATVASVVQKGEVIEPVEHFDEHLKATPSPLHLTFAFDTSPSDGYHLNDGSKGTGFKTRIDLTVRGQNIMMHCDRLLKTLDPRHWLTMEGHLDLKLVIETYDIFQACTKINFEPKSATSGRVRCKYSTSMALVATFKAILVSMFRWMNVYVDWVNFTMSKSILDSDALSKCKKTFLPINEILFMLRYFFLWGQEIRNFLPEENSYGMNIHLPLFENLIQGGPEILPLIKTTDPITLHDFNYGLSSEGVLPPPYIGELTTEALNALEATIARADLKRQSFRAILELALLKINWEGSLDYLQLNDDEDIRTFRAMFGMRFQTTKYTGALNFHAVNQVTGEADTTFVANLSKEDCTFLASNWSKLYTERTPRSLVHQREILDCFTELTKVFFTVDVDFNNQATVTRDGYTIPIWKCNVTCWPLELFECAKDKKISSVSTGTRVWDADFGTPHYQIGFSCNYQSQGAEFHILIDNHTQFHEVNKHDPSPSIEIDGIEVDPHYAPDTTYNDSYASLGEDPSSSLSSLLSMNRYRIGYTHGVDLLLSWLKFQTINKSVQVAPKIFNISLRGDLRRFKKSESLMDVAGKEEEEEEEEEGQKGLTGTLPNISANYNWDKGEEREDYPDSASSRYAKYLFSKISPVQTYCDTLLALNYFTSSNNSRRYTTELSSNMVLQNDHALTNLLLQNVFQILLEEQIWRPRPFIINNGPRSFSPEKAEDLLSVLKSRVIPSSIKAKGLTAAIQSVSDLTWKTSNYGKTGADEEVLISQRTESMAQLAVYEHLEKLLAYPKVIFSPELLKKFKVKFAHKQSFMEALENGRDRPTPLGKEFAMSATEELLFNLYDIFQPFFESDVNLTWDNLQKVVANWPACGKILKDEMEKFDYRTLFRIISNGATPIGGLNYDQYYATNTNNTASAKDGSRKMLYSVIYEKLVHIFIKLRSMEFRKASLNKRDSFDRFKFLTIFEKEEEASFEIDGLGTLSKNLKEALKVQFGEDEGEGEGENDLHHSIAAVERFGKKLDYLLKKESEPKCRIFPNPRNTNSDANKLTNDVSWCFSHFTNSPKTFLTIGGLEYLTAILTELDGNNVAVGVVEPSPFGIMESCSQILNYTFKPKWAWMQPVFTSFIRDDVLKFEKSAHPKKQALPFPGATQATDRDAIYQSLLDKVEKHCLLQLATFYACIKPFGDKFKTAVNSSSDDQPISLLTEDDLNLSELKKTLKGIIENPNSQRSEKNKAVRLFKELKKLKVGYASPIIKSDCPELVIKIPVFSDRMQICRSAVGKSDGKYSRVFEPKVYNIDTGIRIPEAGELEQEQEEEEEEPKKTTASAVVVVVEEKTDSDMVDLTSSADSVMSTPPSRPLPHSSQQAVTAMDLEDEEHPWNEEPEKEGTNELMGLLLSVNKENEKNNNIESKEDPIDTNIPLREAYNLNLMKDYKVYFDQEKTNILPRIIQIVLELQGKTVNLDSEEFRAIVEEETSLMTNLFQDDETFRNIGSEGESWTLLRKFLQWLKTWTMVQHRYEILIAFATSIVNHAVLYQPVVDVDVDDTATVAGFKGDNNGEDEEVSLMEVESTSTILTKPESTRRKKKKKATTKKTGTKLQRDNYETLSVLQQVFFAEQSKALYPSKALHKIVKLLETVRAFELEDTVDKARNLYLAFSLKEKIANPEGLGDEIIEGLKTLFSRPVGGSWFHNALYAGLSNITVPRDEKTGGFTPWNMFHAGAEKVVKDNSYVWDFLSDNAYGRYLIGPQRHWILDWTSPDLKVKKNALTFRKEGGNILYGIGHFFDFDLFSKTVDPDMSGFGFLPPLKGATPSSAASAHRSALVYLQRVQTYFFGFLAKVLQIVKKNPDDLLDELLKETAKFGGDDDSFLAANTKYFQQTIEKVVTSFEGDAKSPIWKDISNIFSDTVTVTGEDGRSLEPIEWLFVTMWTNSCRVMADDEEGFIRNPSKALKKLSFLPILPFARELGKKLNTGYSEGIIDPRELFKPPAENDETDGLFNWDDYGAGGEGDYDDEDESGTHSSSSNSQIDGRMKLIGPRSPQKEDKNSESKKKVRKGTESSITKKKKKRKEKSTGEKALKKGAGAGAGDGNGRSDVAINKATKKREEEAKRAQKEKRAAERDAFISNPPADTTLADYAKYYRLGRSLTFNVSGVVSAILLYLEESVAKSAEDKKKKVRKIINSLACTINLLVLGGIMVRDFHDHGSLLARYNIDTMTPKWSLGSYRLPTPKLPVSLAGLTRSQNEAVERAKAKNEAEKQKYTAKEKARLEKAQKAASEAATVVAGTTRGRGGGRGGRTTSGRGGVKATTAATRGPNATHLPSIKPSVVRAHRPMRFIRQSRQEGVNLEKFWKTKGYLFGWAATDINDATGKSISYVSSNSMPLSTEQLDSQQKEELLLYNLMQTTRLYPRYIHYSKKNKKSSITTTSKQTSSLVRQTFAFEDTADSTKSSATWSPSLAAHMPFGKPIYSLGSHNVDACYSKFPNSSNSRLYYKNDNHMKIDANTLLPKALHVATRVVSISDNLSKYKALTDVKNTASISNTEDILQLGKQMVKYYSSLNILSVTVSESELTALLHSHADDFYLEAFPRAIHNELHHHHHHSTPVGGDGVVLLGIKGGATDVDKATFKLFYSVASNPNPLLTDESYGFKKFWCDTAIWSAIHKELVTEGEGSQQRSPTFVHNIGLTWQDIRGELVSAVHDVVPEIVPVSAKANSDLREAYNNALTRQMRVVQGFLLDRIAQQENKEFSTVTSNVFSSDHYEDEKQDTYLSTLGLRLLKLRRGRKESNKTFTLDQKSKATAKSGPKRYSSVPTPNIGYIYAFVQMESILKYVVDTHIKWVFLNAVASGGTPALSYNNGNKKEFSFNTFDINMNHHTVISAFECRSKPLGAIAPYNLSPVFLPNTSKGGTESQLANATRFYDSPVVPSPLCEPHHTPIDLLHLLVAMMDLTLTRPRNKSDNDNILDSDTAIFEKLQALKRLLAYLYNVFALSQTWCNILDGNIEKGTYAKNANQSGQSTERPEIYRWNIREYHTSKKMFRNLKISVPRSFMSDGDLSTKDLIFESTTKLQTPSRIKRYLPEMMLPSNRDQQSVSTTDGKARTAENPKAKEKSLNQLFTASKKKGDKEEMQEEKEEEEEEEEENEDAERPPTWLKYLDPKWEAVVAAPVTTPIDDRKAPYIAEGPPEIFPAGNNDKNKSVRPPQSAGSLKTYADFYNNSYTHEGKFWQTGNPTLVDTRSHVQKVDIDTGVINPALVETGEIVPAIRPTATASSGVEAVDPMDQKRANLTTLRKVFNTSGVRSAEYEILDRKGQKLMSTNDMRDSALARGFAQFNLEEYAKIREDAEFNTIRQQYLSKQTTAIGERTSALGVLLNQYAALLARASMSGTNRKLQENNLKRQMLNLLVGEDKNERYVDTLIAEFLDSLKGKNKGESVFGSPKDDLASEERSNRDDRLFIVDDDEDENGIVEAMLNSVLPPDAASKVKSLKTKGDPKSIKDLFNIFSGGLISTYSAVSINDILATDIRTREDEKEDDDGPRRTLIDFSLLAID